LNQRKIKFIGFRIIKGYDNLYCVNHEGIVVSPSYTDKRGYFRELRVLKPSKRGKGYLAVGLMKDGKQVPVSVHRLVAKAFIPNPENKPQVNHKDGNKENNHVNNLEWVTNQENIRHSYDTGLRVGTNHKGERNNMAKLTLEQVQMIKNSQKSVIELAEEFNVSRSCVYKIRKGTRWAGANN